MFFIYRGRHIGAYFPLPPIDRGRVTNVNAVHTQFTPITKGCTKKGVAQNKKAWYNIRTSEQSKHKRKGGESGMNGGKTQDPHDTRLKELFGNREAFVSLLRDCVKAEWADDLDEENLKPSEHSFILQDFKKKEADVVYEGTLNKGAKKVIFYILLELQKKVDYRMPYRLLLYIVEILRQYYNQSDEKARARKDFKFPAVFPMVFYVGSRKWTVPLNLREMFYGHERFGENLINFKYALVDAKDYDGGSVEGFGSRLLKVMMLLEKSTSYAGIWETILAYVDEIMQLTAEEYRILSMAVEIFGEIYGQTGNSLEEIIKQNTAEGVKSMLVDVYANAKNYEKILRKEGEKRGEDREKKKAEKKALAEKTESIKIMLEMGDSVEKISKVMKHPIEGVEKIKAGLKS